MFKYIASSILFLSPISILPSVPYYYNPSLMVQSNPRNPVRFLDNLEYLIVKEVEGRTNVNKGQVIKNIREVISVETGYIELISNDETLTIRAEAGTRFYVSDRDIEKQTMNIYIEEGFIKASLVQREDTNREVILNTPGGYAAIRGTEISLSVNPKRIAIGMLEDKALVGEEEYLLQGNVLLIYPGEEKRIIPLEEEYQVFLEEFRSENNKFLIKGRTNRQNTLRYKDKYLDIDSEGRFYLEIPINPINKEFQYFTLITPLGTRVDYSVSYRGIF